MSIYLSFQICFPLFPSRYGVCIKFFLCQIWPIISELQVEVISSIIKTYKQYISVNKEFLSRRVYYPHKFFKSVACHRNHVKFLPIPMNIQKSINCIWVLSPESKPNAECLGLIFTENRWILCHIVNKAGYNLFTFPLKKMNLVLLHLLS